jgi:hypothetical protein
MFSEEHFLDLEDAGSMLLWNVGKSLPDYTAALGKIWCSLQPGTDVLLQLLNVFLACRPAVFCAAQYTVTVTWFNAGQQALSVRPAGNPEHLAAPGRQSPRGRKSSKMNALKKKIDFLSSDIFILRQITGTAMNNCGFCEVHSLSLSVLSAGTKHLAGHALPVVSVLCLFHDTNISLGSVELRCDQ